GEPNVVDALSWFNRGASQDDPYCQFAVADILLRYAEVLDTEKGLMWMERSAELGHVDAQFALAKIYQRADMVPRDTQKFLSWMTAAAEQDDIDAIVELANYYYIHRGEDRNLKKALKWLKKALRFGHGESEVRYIQCQRESEDAK